MSYKTRHPSSSIINHISHSSCQSFIMPNHQPCQSFIIPVIHHVRSSIIPIINRIMSFIMPVIHLVSHSSCHSFRYCLFCVLCAAGLSCVLWSPVGCCLSWCVLVCPGLSWSVLVCPGLSWCVLVCPGLSCGL